MDFSLPVKRYDTDGMFNSPPGPPSPNLPSRSSGQALSKLDLIFSRPGVLRNTGIHVNSPQSEGSSRVQGPSMAHQNANHQHQPHSFAPPRSLAQTPQQSYSQSSQRSPVIVNQREHVFQMQRDDSQVARSSSGMSHNGIGIPIRTNAGAGGIPPQRGGIGNPVQFLQPSHGSRFRPPAPSIRAPPMYDSLRHLQGSGRGGTGAPVGQRMSLRPTGPPGATSRPLRFAPPMKPPPPPPQRTEPPRHIRDYVIHANASSASSSTAGRAMTHDPDTLAKISELAKITRASIPMSPLEDEADFPTRRELAMGSSFRELMPPPSSRGTVRTPSPAGMSGRSLLLNTNKDGMSQEAMNAVASQLGIQVEVVHKLTPPPPIIPTMRTRFPALQEMNLGFSNFASAVAFLTLDEPPLNPLEIESSKDVLISIFGPKMTLYRCGGCESTFVFRSVFSDHLYRGIVPYRLRCSHCKDTLAFTNICQVKDHVRSHGYTNFQMAKGFVLTVAEVNDENTQPGESMGAKLAAEQLAKSAPGKGASLFVPVAGSSGMAKGPHTANRMLQEMLKRSEEPVETQQRLVLQSSGRQPEVASSRSSQPPISNPLRNSAAHALQRLRMQVEAQELMKSQQQQSEFIPVSSRPPNGPPQQQSQQPGLLRQIIRTSASPQATSSFETPRAAPKIPCPYCRSTFDGQSGLTHHFQRFKDVTDAATNYRCRECKVVCCNQCSYDAHQRIHQLNRSNPNMSDICCPECGFKLESIDEITSHIERRCVHWCRILCCSYSCCMQHCRYSSTSEEDYFVHMINSHTGQPDGRNVCPVCRVPVNGSRAVLMEHLSSNNSCRQQILQQKSMFFAYHCVYCDEKNAPVFETKAAMRDHIGHVHAAGLPKSIALPASHSPATTNLVLAHAKRISSFNDFENAFKRPNSAGGGGINDLLARRTAESSAALQPGPGGIYPVKTYTRVERPLTQAPAPANSNVLHNLSLLKRTLTEEDPRSPPTKKVHLSPAFGCQLCTYEGRSHEELAAHMEHHQAARELSVRGEMVVQPKTSARYECKVCEMDHSNFTCDSAPAFHDHLRRVHPAKDTSFQCSECGLQLLSMSVLQMHLRVNHSVGDPNAFFAASSFYAGMRMLRSNPTANFVTALHRSVSSMGAGSAPDQRPPLPSGVRMSQPPSGIFQHTSSSSSPNEQSGGPSHN